MAQLDPELIRQMTAADADETVEAVVRLKPDAGASTTEPEETERLTHELVERVQRTSGRRESGVNVFRFLGSFAISAEPSFLKALVEQPEVEAAVANRQPGPAMIKPVSKRPATLKEVGRETKRPKVRTPKTRRSAS